jgi:hypothetical protein
MLNTIVMAMRYARMSYTYERVLEIFDYIFAAVFNIECILKILGLCWRYFTLSRWNQFDFFIVVGTDFGLLMNVLNLGIDISTTVTVIRAFRIMRIVRLLKSYGKVVLNTLVNIIPSITNILSLIFLLFLIYSALGISQFATARFGETRRNYNEIYNFRDFSKSLILLMRCSTGENWNLVMTDLLNQENCASNQTYEKLQANGINGCGSSLSYLYFISFMVVLSMVVMNLSVAAVIDGLAEARKDSSSCVKKDHLAKLIDLWKEYDPKAKGHISIDDLVCLLYELPQPLGLGRNSDNIGMNFDPDYEADPKKNNMNDNPFAKLIRLFAFAKPTPGEEHLWIVKPEQDILLRRKFAFGIMRNFNVQPLENNMVHFKDVCIALAHRVFRRERDNDLHAVNQGKIKTKFKKAWQQNSKISKSSYASRFQLKSRWPERCSHTGSLNTERRWRSWLAIHVPRLRLPFSCGCI